MYGILGYRLARFIPVNSPMNTRVLYPSVPTCVYSVENIFKERIGMLQSLDRSVIVRDKQHQAYGDRFS